MEQSRNAYRVLARRPEGRRLLGRPRRRWEYNLKDVSCDAGDWIDLDHDINQWQACVRAIMNLLVL